MFPTIKKSIAGLIAAAAVMLAAVPAMAAVDGETAYVFNTFSFLFNGALVMWMAAGFAMLESGLVRDQEHGRHLPEEHRALFRSQASCTTSSATA